MSLQAPSAVVMIRPHHFLSNPETQADNSYQKAANCTPEDVAATAKAEFDGVVSSLRAAAAHSCETVG